LHHALPKVDGIFVHMCPEYLIAGWPLFARHRKPVMLWYAHRQANRRVRMGERMADVVGTVSETSFPFASPKVRALGHGIPTDRFVPKGAPAPGRLIAVGRITPIKRLELLIDAVGLLRKDGIDARLDLWGEPAVPSDRAYKEHLQRRIARLGLGGAVAFRGAAPHDRMPEIDASAAVALNACPDGALDKAVLEAMSCGTPVVVTNRNFAEVLGADAASCLAAGDPAAIAAGIRSHLAETDHGLGARLRAAVERAHSLTRLIGRIITSYGRSGA
jgi:glycosyltransferase involved in cell wall biosynthesis